MDWMESLMVYKPRAGRHPRLPSTYKTDENLVFKGSQVWLRFLGPAFHLSRDFQAAVKDEAGIDN